MTRRLPGFLLASLASLPVTAQDGNETATDAAQRVLRGGTFSEAKWRRGDDGMLQLEMPDRNAPETARFVPLLGEHMVEGLAECGFIGYLSLCCHGNGDLLGMTDAEFHLRCLGIDVTEAGLRRYLALPLPAFDGQRGRAELFDRLLAIDLLRRRGSKQSVAELEALAGKQEAPALLRERALGAIQRQPGRRLDPGKLLLPATFDGCLVIDHGLLPDMGWLTAAGRRLGMVITAHAALAAEGRVSLASCIEGQRFSDVAGELPFGVALRFGNLRLDQSCIVVTARDGPPMPVAITVAAAGSFESERWKTATRPPGLKRNNLLLGGKLDVASDLLQASTDGSVGQPRPELAQELLRDTGAAIRAVIPADSKLWGALAFLELPAAKGAELRVTFGNPCRLVLTVTTGDEEATKAWLEKGSQLVAQGKAALDPDRQPRLRDNAELRLLVDALLGAGLTADGDKAIATIAIKGFDRHKLAALIEKIPH